MFHERNYWGGGRRPFFGPGPFLGGLLGGVIGGALFRHGHIRIIRHIIIRTHTTDILIIGRNIFNTIKKYQYESNTPLR